ncbi:MAG: hypothetical protein SFX72_11455 [Isosphaeraceae bacterium]|nr:hypothetical protein [Isosphaeraceae bacterium]
MRTTDPAASVPAPARPASEPRRLFIHEPAWRVALKSGSEREYCYMMAPGQDYYHRLLDGEIYLTKGDEKLCFACAQRRGLLAAEGKQLRPSIAGLAVEIDRLLEETGIALVERPDLPDRD